MAKAVYTIELDTSKLAEAIEALPDDLLDRLADKLADRIVERASTRRSSLGGQAVSVDPAKGWPE